MKFIYKLLINLVFCLLIALIRVRTNDNIDDNLLSNLNVVDDKEMMKCSSQHCSNLKPECFNCNFNYSCVYGTIMNTSCVVSNIENSNCQVMGFFCFG